jgi:hypothetical protein
MFTGVVYLITRFLGKLKRMAAAQRSADTSRHSSTEIEKQSFGKD